jgi:hypothetical protein
MVQAARELLKRPSAYRERLRQIISGKVKSVDADWWRTANGVAPWQVAKNLEKEFRKKLDKVTAMADPARNPSAHERRSAEAALAKLQAAGPAKTRPPSAPGLEQYDRELAQRMAEQERIMDAAFKAAKAKWDAKRKRNTAPVNTTEVVPPPVNTTKPKPKAASVNTTTKLRQATKPVNTTAAVKPRSADRHREPNRDRHSPGYMRDYMRRRRAKQKA